MDKPVSSSMLLEAMEVAREFLPEKIPKVYAIGENCEVKREGSFGGTLYLSWIAEEYVVSDTVENKVMPPDDRGFEIWDDISQRLFNKGTLANRAHPVTCVTS